MNARKWKLLDSRYVLQTDFIQVTSDKVQTSGGHVIESYFAVHEPDFVATVAQQSDGKLVALKQYRYPANIVSLEFAGGVVNAGEQPIQAAQRELLEETGFSGSGWTSLGSLYVNPGRNTNRLHLFFLGDATRIKKQDLDASEQASVVLMPVADFRRAISEGQVLNCLHVAAFGMASERVSGDTIPISLKNKP